MGINLLHRKEQLILTAIDIIDELGIQKLTTREIARRQGVSEATLFRHFKNKNELLLAVLDYFIQFDEDILQSTKMNELKPMEALQFHVISYAEYYENYPAITAILQLFDVLRYEEELADKIKYIQESRTAMLQHLVEEAQRTGEICKEVNSNMLAVIISGFCREICLNWRLAKGTYSLRERTLTTLGLLLNTIGNTKEYI
ncbi:MAG: transcriptional regulator TetR family [Herbinix sp.]|jgi:AcrR family transcriptional regulator|nr:transcriptional regulator TetR family [Herbinix sp.]